MIEKENTVSSDLVYTGKTISLRVDTVEVPNKGYQKREIVEHNGVVVIIGITEDNKIILIKQYRKSIEDTVLELRHLEEDLGLGHAQHLTGLGLALGNSFDAAAVYF